METISQPSVCFTDGFTHALLVFVGSVIIHMYIVLTSVVLTQYKKKRLFVYLTYQLNSSITIV